MPSFRYQVRQTGGNIATGTLQADNLFLATEQARQMGGQVLDMVQVGTDQESKPGALKAMLGSGVSGKDLYAFTNQLAVMAKAGISLTAALEGIADQTTNPRLRQIIQTMKRDVEAGRQFSETLQRFPNVFSPLYVNMVRASELAGSFGHMLTRIAEYLSQQIETRRQVKGAMVYPIIIVVLAIVTTIFMLTFVLPRFAVLFEGKEAILPLPTKILMGMSDSLVHFWYLYIVGAGALAGGAIAFLRTDVGHTWWDGAKLKIPVLKGLCHAIYLQRGLRTMGELVNAGVPMLDTIGITADVTGNIHYARVWRRVHAGVRKGQRISPVLMRSALFPNSVAQMIAAGEETGSLGEIMNDVSEFYEQQLKATTKTVTAAIEPIMIILMGGIVAFIAASILLPIFKMSQLVG